MAETTNITVVRTDADRLMDIIKENNLRYDTSTEYENVIIVDYMRWYRNKKNGRIERHYCFKAFKINSDGSIERFIGGMDISKLIHHDGQYKFLDAISYEFIKHFGR